eukprot:1147041-Pelagomonas_calceolata.AAC.2
MKITTAARSAEKQYAANKPLSATHLPTANSSKNPACNCREKSVKMSTHHRVGNPLAERPREGPKACQ